MNFIEKDLRGKFCLPEAWVHLMEAIRGENWVSFVAGGAVRDLYHGVKPKDVDIWVSQDNLDELERLLAHEFPEAKVLCDSEYTQNLRVRKVWEFSFGQTQVNVIAFPGQTPRDCVEKFDLTMSQCFVLPFDTTIGYFSEAFLADSAAKVFRQIREDDSEGRTARRVRESLLPRYPGWRFEGLPGPSPQLELPIDRHSAG